MSSSIEDPNEYSRPECVDPAVLDLPPSAKLVRLALVYEESLTQGALAELTGLNDRTVRYAIKRLDDAELLGSGPNITDARQTVYWLRDPPDDLTDTTAEAGNVDEDDDTGMEESG